MKFWEVLRAVEEGKTVQYCNYLGEFVTAPNPRDWTAEDAESKQWRIKPEPKTLYVAEQKNGLFFAYESESSAKSCNFDSRKGPIRKFVEVMED